MTASLASVLGALTERLADPRIAPGSQRSLLEREGGLALLYAELGRHDPKARALAHRHLAAANRSLTPASPHTLFDGIPALAFAARCAARQEGEYAALLDGLDSSVFAIARTRLEEERRRLDAGETLHTVRSFDLVSGLTGLGSYLFRRGTGDAESLLREILASLVRLVRPIRRDGVRLPGWWAEQGPVIGQEHRGGHVNLGMAHGIGGPLALLATTWTAGIRVPEQDAALAEIVAFLVGWSDVDGSARFWPPTLTLDGERLTASPRSRESWCYGRPGIARAIQLAGLALHREDWLTHARESVRDLATLPGHRWEVRDTGLCHGWSGLLHVLGRMQHDDPGCGLGTVLDRIAGRVLAEFDPRMPFGYRQHSRPGAPPTDEPGFLTGAAGIALAVHAYCSAEPKPASGWDSALLAG
ncbi:lanthionine synthetase C family protein [Sciscionella sediminilitoris]|uniref:lanthionine synthetase C family protein n=1 Tax=Sciscionella sediminilitoris TaxID=1445613 RepID=UPI00056971BB|nr:lanthionine synthetase C family protein [Sciscionella sp. SE31]